MHPYTVPTPMLVALRKASTLQLPPLFFFKPVQFQNNVCVHMMIVWSYTYNEVRIKLSGTNNNSSAADEKNIESFGAKDMPQLVGG